MKIACGTDLYSLLSHGSMRAYSAYTQRFDGRGKCTDQNKTTPSTKVITNTEDTEKSQPSETHWCSCSTDVQSPLLAYIPTDLDLVVITGCDELVTTRGEGQLVDGTPVASDATNLHKHTHTVTTAKVWKI